MDYSQVRGFNYQPSYGSTSLENWLYYNPSMVELELRRGKEYFPKFNVVRYWLSWDAYQRNAEQFIKNFETGLTIADRLGIKVIPCLFNRWHDSSLDNGGIYIDHFMPCSSFVYRENNFDKYVNDVVSNHIDDNRILIWDICNEPFWYPDANDIPVDMERYEYAWLENMYNLIKSIDRNKPVGSSLHHGHGRAGVERIEPISDILMVHPYYIPQLMSKKEYVELVSSYKEFSLECKKPVLATETCWGSMDDARRVELIKYTLDTLTEYEIGFVVHALHYSKVADLHTSEDGPIGFSENLAFTNADGTLRAGHDIFNKY